MKVNKIEDNLSFQKGLGDIFRQKILVISIFLTILCLLNVVKTSIFYFSFNLYEDYNEIYKKIDIPFSKVINFLIVPEMLSFSNSILFTLQDYFQLINMIVTSIFFILLYIYVEKKYGNLLVEINSEPQLMLFTIEISKLKNLDELDSLVNLFKLLRPTENCVLDVSHVYNMFKYEQQKKIILLSNSKNFSSTSLQFTETREDLELCDNDLDIDTQRKSRKTFIDNHDQLFSGKVFVTLNDISLVKDIIELYEEKCFTERIRNELEKTRTHPYLTKEETLFLEEMAEDKDDIFKRVKIQISHSPNDICWQNTGYQNNKMTLLKLLIYLLLCLLIFILIFIMKYYGTYFSL